MVTLAATATWCPQVEPVRQAVDAQAAAAGRNGGHRAGPAGHQQHHVPGAQQVRQRPRGRAPFWPAPVAALASLCRHPVFSTHDRPPPPRAPPTVQLRARAPVLLVFLHGDLDSWCQVRASAIPLGKAAALPCSPLTLSPSVSQVDHVEQRLPALLDRGALVDARTAQQPMV